MAPDAEIIELSIDRNAPVSPSTGDLPPLEGVGDTAVRILLAGLELFADRGYHATSIRDIAAGAGLQSASLYTHFASKEAILTELVNIGFTVHHRSLMSSLLDCGSDPREQLRTLIRAHVAAHCRWPKLAGVTTRELKHLSDQAAAPALALRESSIAMLAEIVGRGLEQGLFTVTNREITLSAIGTLGTAAINWYPAQAARYTPEEVGVIYADLTLQMVGAAS